MLERTPKTETFIGAAGNKLAADSYGNGERAAILLHGGGQTRHAFAGTARALAKSGWTAFTIDQRGHGDSDWVEGGHYSVFDFADDITKVAGEIAKRFSAPPILIGASLGGMAGMIAEGGAAMKSRPPNISALLLVDVTPRIDIDGASKIRSCMRGHVD